jgi:hypothetical protein
MVPACAFLLAKDSEDPDAALPAVPETPLAPSPPLLPDKPLRRMYPDPPKLALPFMKILYDKVDTAADPVTLRFS